MKRKKEGKINDKISRYLSLLIIFLFLFLGAGIFFLVKLNLKSEKARLSNINNISSSGSIPNKKILYVASYSLDSDWGKRIKSGIESVLKSREDIELKVFAMETMGMTAEDEGVKKIAALKAKSIIDKWQPDVVITSDDNASKYLIVPYFTGSDIPFVFCGVNWDASKYGFPSKNVTGMIEVQLVKQLVEYLKPYSQGPRIGSLRGNTMTNRNESKYVEKELGVQVLTYFVDDIKEWKESFIKLQEEVDIVLIGDIDAVKFNDESKEDIEKFMLDSTKVPTGRWDEHYKNDALITLATIPEEQGEYAALAALEILAGKSVTDIPLVKNKKAKIILNMKLAKKMDIIFPVELVEVAQIIPAN